MANPPFELPVATASVSWVDSSNAMHLHVFWSDGYTVFERAYEAGKWVNGAFKQPGSQVSATAYRTSNGTSIRVYCTGADVVTEWCLDPNNANWYQGSFTIS